MQPSILNQYESLHGMSSHIPENATNDMALLYFMIRYETIYELLNTNNFSWLFIVGFGIYTICNIYQTICNELNAIYQNHCLTVSTK